MLSLADLGFGSAMVYAMYEPIANDDKESICALMHYFRKIYIIIGIVVLLIGIATMPFIKYFINGKVPDDINLYVLFLIYLTNTSTSYLMFAYRASIFSAYQREAVNFKIQLFTNLSMYIIQIVSLMTFENYYLYIIVIPAFTILYNFIRYRYAMKEYPTINCKGNITIKQKAQIKKNISALLLHKIGNVTVNTLDNIIISAFLGLVILSDYNNYYYLISAVTSMVLIFFNSITAGIGNKIITSDIDKIQKDFYDIFYLNAFVVSVSTVCFFNMFQDFIVVWVGSESLLNRITMVMICVYFFIHTIRRTIIAYRDGAGMWYDNRLQPIVSALLNLVLNIVTIQYIGINGVVLSTVLSMVIVDIPWETKKLINNLLKMETKSYYYRFVLYLGITIITCILSCIMIKWLDLHNLIVRLMCECIISLIISIGGFVIVTKNMSEYRRFKGRVRRIIKNTIS